MTTVIILIILVALLLLIPFNAKAMAERQRTRCEVYQRIVGYLRPVKNFNPGKFQEYKDRKYFDSALNNNVNKYE
jgi:ribonucleoside-triphosphate reductase